MRFAAFLLTCCAFFQAAWSQQNSPLTLDRAVEIALERSPAVSAAREQILEAEARLRQARADYYPQIGSSGLAKAGLSGSLNGLQPVGLPNSPFYRNFAEALNIYHPGLDFGRTKHAARFARHGVEALRSDLGATEAQLVFEVTRSFYRLLQTRKLREVAEKTVSSRESTLRQARAFYEGELRSKVDFDLARVGLSEAQLAALEADNEIRITMAELARSLGDTQESNYTLAEPEWTPPQLTPLADWLQQAYEGRPELASLEAQRLAASEAVSLARSRRKPRLSFFFSGGWARIAPLTASKLLAIGTGLNLPVFTFGKLEGVIEEAEARLRVLDFRLEDQRQQVALETRRAYYRLQNALESIPVRQVQTEAAGEAVRLARARYREQLGSIVELDESESRLAQADGAEVSARYAAKIAEAELDFAAGRIRPPKDAPLDDSSAESIN